MSVKLEYYNDAAGDYRWRLTNRENGEIVAAATEGFPDLRHAMDNYELSREAPAEVYYPGGTTRGPAQVIRLEGQDFQTDADADEGGTESPAGVGEQSEDGDSESSDEASVDEGRAEEQREGGSDPAAGSLPPATDGKRAPKAGGRR